MENQRIRNKINKHKSFFASIIDYFISMKSIVLAIFTLLGVVSLVKFGLLIDYEFLDIVILYFLLWFLFLMIFAFEIKISIFIFMFASPLINFLIFKNIVIDISIMGILINYSIIYISIIIFRSRKTLFFNYKTIFVLILLMVFGLISSLYSSQLYISINGLIYGLLQPFLLYLILKNKTSSIEEIHFFIDGSIFIFVVLNAFFFILAIIGIIGVDVFDSRYSGLVNSPNTFAPWALLITFFIVYRIFSSSNFFIKVINFSFFIFSIVLILLSGSRASLLILVFGLLLLFLIYAMHMKNIKHFLKLLIQSSVISLFVISIFLIIGSNLDFITINRFEELGFYSGRIEIWEDTLDYIISKKLYFNGLGMGNFLFATYNIFGRSTPHNSILNMAVSIGLIGSIIYHIFIIFHLKIHIKNKETLIFNVIIIILMIFMIFVTFEPMYFNRQSEIFRFDDVLFRSMNTNIYVLYLWSILGMMKGKHIYG